MRVAVVGLGLIGGSIGLSSRGRAGAHVRGYDPDEVVLSRALERGAIDEPAEDLAAAVGDAEVVFVAAPVGSLAQAIALTLDAAGPECVVSDVGSTKGALVGLGFDGRFVGGHPLAGAETAGIDHAREDLFDGASWYLMPAGQTPSQLYQRLRALIRALGASPIEIDARSHDRLMARISHLPHVFANLLVAEAARAFDGPAHPLGPSFRDATRVAGANTGLWTDIYLSNREALMEAIQETSVGLEEVRAALAAGDAAALAAWHESARADRQMLLGDQ